MTMDPLPESNFARVHMKQRAVDVTDRDDVRLLRGRRPGNGMRSAMLLSGLTTWLRTMTASRNASIVGSSASSPSIGPD